MRITLVCALLLLSLTAPAWAPGVSIGPWQWSYDAGLVMVRGQMNNNSGLSLPITIYAMEGTQVLHEHPMTVTAANSTDYSFMFRRDAKPSALKLEWGARNGSGY